MIFSRKKDFIHVAALILIITLSAVCLHLAYLRFYRAAYPIHHKDTVLAYANELDLPPELVFAVIHCESGFNHQAVSYVEARGLMQITEETFEWAKWRMGDSQNRSFDDMFTAEINIKYGTAILNLLLEEFIGEKEALAAYHAGWGSVKGWLGNQSYSADGITLDNIPFVDTRGYVDKVLKTKNIYKKLYNL